MSTDDELGKQLGPHRFEIEGELKVVPQNFSLPQHNHVQILPERITSLGTPASIAAPRPRSVHLYYGTLTIDRPTTHVEPKHGLESSISSESFNFFHLFTNFTSPLPRKVAGDVHLPSPNHFYSRAPLLHMLIHVTLSDLSSCAPGPSPIRIRF